jgi:ribosomal-protein-alanine N-acetyltransferase
MTRQGMAPFETARLVMRPFVISDADQAFTIFGDAEVMRYSLSGQDHDRSATAERIARYMQNQERNGFAQWAAVDTKSSEVVGFCGLTRVDKSDDVEIAYRFRRDRWGQGLATEAAGAMIGRGFAALNLPRILAFIDPANTASERVACKIGMNYLEDALYAGRIPVRTFAITNPRAVPPPAS